MDQKIMVLFLVMHLEDRISQEFQDLKILRSKLSVLYMNYIMVVQKLYHIKDKYLIKMESQLVKLQKLSIYL